jgi:hypothetical protein
MHPAQDGMLWRATANPQLIFPFDKMRQNLDNTVSLIFSKNDYVADSY